MRKQDVEVGEHYASSNARDYVRWGNATRVVVVDNEDYRTASRYSVSERALREDIAYVRMHEQDALCQAYERETTPAEREEAARALKTARERAIDGYWDAQPYGWLVRAKTSRGGEGVLCRIVDRKTGMDPEEGPLYSLVPRRELKETWSSYAYKADEQRKYDAELNVARHALAARNEALAVRLRGLLAEAGWPGVYVSDHGDSVSLSKAFLVELLVDLPAKEDA
jgi:hypothetical protein